LAAEVRGCGTRDVALAALIWKGGRDWDVKTMIRVARRVVVKTAAKKGHVREERARM
jgi:hypothetical protein